MVERRTPCAPSHPRELAHFRSVEIQASESTYSYGDYDVVSYTRLTGTKIEFAADNSLADFGWEAFCVSKDNLKPLTDTFNFYAAIDMLGGNTNFVTSVANWATGSGRTEADKAYGQKPSGKLLVLLQIQGLPQGIILWVLV